MMYSYYQVIVTMLLATSTVSGQDCTNSGPVFNRQEYSGNIVIGQDGHPVLVGDTTMDGIALLLDCGDLVQDITISPEQYVSQFDIEPVARIVGINNKIVLTDSYNLITNYQIQLTISACDPNNACAEAVVLINYPYNNHPPTFNKPFGEGVIEDTEACTDTGCPVDLGDDPLSCTDGDGDVLKYSIIPFTEHSNLFEMPDNSALNIKYKGNGVSQDTKVTLMVKAEDNRMMVDSLSTVVVVRIQLKTTATTATAPPESTATTATTPPATTATAPPESPECDDKNKKIYFIAMIVLASVLGALLLLLLLIPLCVICCRSTSLGISNSRKATVKRSGVSTAGATYKSFSEMNYVTLADLPPSYPSTPELGVRVENHSSGRVRSRPKSSTRDRLPGRDSFSSDSTASAQDRGRRGDSYS